MQRVHLRAAVGVGMALQILAAGRQPQATPEETVASYFGCSGMHWIVDGQVQCVHLYAAVGIGVAVQILAAGHLPLPTPEETIAGSFGDGGVFRVVDVDGKYSDGVAARRIN